MEGLGWGGECFGHWNICQHAICRRVCKYLTIGQYSGTLRLSPSTLCLGKVVVVVVVVVAVPVFGFWCGHMVVKKWSWRWMETLLLLYFLQQSLIIISPPTFHVQPCHRDTKWLAGFEPWWTPRLQVSAGHWRCVSRMCVVRPDDVQPLVRSDNALAHCTSKMSGNRSESTCGRQQRPFLWKLWTHWIPDWSSRTAYLAMRTLSASSSLVCWFRVVAFSCNI